MTKYLLTIQLALIFLVKPSFALNEYGVNKQIENKIFETFYVDDIISNEKINIFKEEIVKRRNEVTIAIEKDGLKRLGDSPEEVSEDIEDEDVLLAYNLILKELGRIEELERVEQFQAIQKIFELQFATTIKGNIGGFKEGFKLVRNVLKRWSISKNSMSTEGEASNLIDVETGKFYDQSELDQMKAEGRDLSLLSPTREGSFWKPKDISKLEVEKNLIDKSDFLDGVKIKFPDGSAKYKKVIKTQTKPKIKISKKIKGKKYNFKLKIGAEMHSEVTAGALFMALGYGSDVSKYVRDFKITLPENMTLIDFKKEWNSYYAKFDIDTYIKSSKINDENNVEIVFHEGLLEAKPKKLKRIGPWPWGSNGHRGKRELRAILIFNMWIANLDIKEADNNKLILKKSKKDGKYEMLHYQHDMGFSFGRFTREKPGDFPWTLVKSAKKGVVKFNYNNFQSNSGFDHVTFSDAKWMTRLIAKLSRKQISEAVRLGGWPKGTDRLLTEKLIARRNQLVKAFDLSDEVDEIPFERNLTTDDGVVKNGILTKITFEGYTQDFGDEVGEILGPLKKGAEALAIDGLLAGFKEKLLAPLAKALEASTVEGINYLASNTEFIGLDPKGFDWETSYIANVKFRPSRTVKANPHALGDNDNFLVEDTLEVKFGLGVKLGLKVSASYFKTYKIIYPVKTKREGLYYNNFIFDILLPRRISKGDLPDRYVLIKESGMEYEKGIRASFATVPFGGTSSYIRQSLSRMVVTKKRDGYKVFEDVETGNGFLGDIFYDVKIFELPLWERKFVKGSLNRSIYFVDLSQDADAPRKELALKQYIASNNIKYIKDFSTKSGIESDFKRTNEKISILGLFTASKKKRQDNLRHFFFQGTKKIGEKEHKQVGILNKWKWKMINDGEEKTSYIRVMGSPNKVVDEYNNIATEIRFEIIDKDTKSNELKSYISAVNNMALDSSFIDFSPNLHSRNGHWGKTTTKVNILYDQDAIDRIAKNTFGAFWKAVKDETGRGRSHWILKRRGSRHGNGTMYRIRGKRYYEFDKALTDLREANRAEDKVDALAEMFSAALQKEGQVIDPLILRTINEVAGKENFFIKAIFKNSVGKELRFPAKTPVYNHQGKLTEIDVFYPFEQEDFEEAWKIFTQDFY